MNDFIEESTPVTRQLVPESQRLAVTAELFGAHFPLAIEPMVYGITERMARDYQGGFWRFWRLSNSGFYMAPDSNQVYQVVCDNCYQGELSGDALGIVASLYGYSHLSFTGNGSFPRVCARQYHLLRHFMFEHTEVSNILGAID